MAEVVTKTVYSIECHIRLYRKSFTKLTYVFEELKISIPKFHFFSTHNSRTMRELKCIGIDSLFLFLTSTSGIPKRIAPRVIPLPKN